MVGLCCEYANFVGFTVVVLLDVGCVALIVLLGCGWLPSYVLLWVFDCGSLALALIVWVCWVYICLGLFALVGLMLDSLCNKLILCGLRCYMGVGYLLDWFMLNVF